MKTTQWHAGHIGLDEFRRECVFDANHGQVATIIDRGVEGQAVARLIAEAPELLEICRAWFATQTTMDRIEWMERARGAISRATA